MLILFEVVIHLPIEVFIIINWQNVSLHILIC